MDDGTGYDLNDPKHPTFRERYADAADLYRKRRREQGEEDAVQGHRETAPIQPGMGAQESPPTTTSDS